MRVRRPKTKFERCAHCRRRRARRFIEWHPGILEWQCSDFDDCDKVIQRRIAYRKRRPVMTPAKRLPPSPPGGYRAQHERLSGVQGLVVGAIGGLFIGVTLAAFASFPTTKGHR